MLRLNANATNASTLRHVRAMPAGPARLAKLLRLLDEDVQRLPLAADPPAEVAEALKAYEGAAAWARQVSGEVETSEQAARQAAAHDVEAAAQAFREGKAPPKVTQLRAAEGITGALVGAEAGERLLEEAHGRLVDTVQAAWPTWRAQIVKHAGEAHAAAALAAQKASAAVTAARASYDAVGRLDAEMLARDAQLSSAARAEQRQGIGWYQATHDARPPLRLVSLPNGKAAVNMDLVKVAEALGRAVAAPAAFAAADWRPPTDPEHAALMGGPLDLGAPWVLAAVRREHGDACELCGRASTDAVTEQDGRLTPVHDACLRRPPSPEERKRAERLATLSREGFDDPTANYTVDADDAHHPMPREEE